MSNSGVIILNLVQNKPIFLNKKSSQEQFPDSYSIAPSTVLYQHIGYSIENEGNCGKQQVIFHVGERFGDTFFLSEFLPDKSPSEGTSRQVGPGLGLRLGLGFRLEFQAYSIVSRLLIIMDVGHMTFTESHILKPCNFQNILEEAALLIRCPVLLLIGTSKISYHTHFPVDAIYNLPSSQPARRFGLHLLSFRVHITCELRISLKSP